MDTASSALFVADLMGFLNWDMGNGFALDEVLSSGRVVIVFALAMTVLTWSVISQKVGL